jgi:rhodanese-related sulfurtransferase
MYWLVLTMLACGNPQQGGSQPVESPGEQEVLRSDVTVEALAAALSSGARVIDVRTPAEFASGHVPGAVSIPMDQLSQKHPVLSAHPSSEPLYLICHSGGRSARAADTLARDGFRAVNVLGGTAAWRERGFDVE